MIKTFTEDDLVRFIYGETSLAENNEIEYALMCSQDTQEMYANLLETVSALDGLEKTPSEKVVNKILNYSKNYGDISVLK